MLLSQAAEEPRRPKTRGHRGDGTDPNGGISKGASLPAAARREATVVGKSWMEAVFRTTSRQSSLLAIPPQPTAILRAARMPRGVAALPSPRRFAETLAVTAASVSSSRLERGKSRRSTGRKAPARRAEIPQAFMTSITPLQRHRIPAIERASSMAEDAPSMAAAATASICPVQRPHIRESTTIAVHVHVIAMLFPPFGGDFCKMLTSFKLSGRLIDIICRGVLLLIQGKYR